MEALSASWLSAVEKSGLDDRTIFVSGTWLVHIGVFWGLNFILFIFYKFNMFPKYRIQGEKMPSNELIWDCIKLVGFNHLIQPIFLYFLYPVFVHFGMTVRGPLPGIPIIIRDVLASIAFNDTFFYWAHRALHDNRIYQYIHKKHHNFHVNVGIAAEYAHPVEDLLANIVPTITGCLLLGSHVCVLWFWLAIRLTETVDAHSGYEFPLSPFSLLPFQGGADRHDFHHSHNTGCYGAFTIFWDSITGTDATFLSFIEKKKQQKKMAGVETNKSK